MVLGLSRLFANGARENILRGEELKQATEAAMREAIKECGFSLPQ